MFGALGLYPEVPGVGLLAVGSPLFRHASIHLHGGRRVLITAAGASPRNPYIEAMRFNGHPYGRPWTTWCALARGARLTFRLGSRPNRGLGRQQRCAPGLLRTGAFPSPQQLRPLSRVGSGVAI